MKREVVIIGAGRTGRGMLGELYHADGFHITFADNSPQLVAGLRQQGYYTVKMSNVTTGEVRETRVTDFDILDTVHDHDAYINALASVNLISTALMPDAFDQVISDLLEAIRLRMARGTEDLLFITLGANYVGLFEYYDSRLRAALSPAETVYFDNYVRLVMSIVNRKNLLPKEEEKTEDAYRLTGDDKSVLRVEDLEDLRALQILPGFFRLENNLSAAMVVKIWTGNLVQCCMAFVALSHGITRSYDASFHSLSSSYAYYAAAEGYSAVAAQYGLPPRTIEEMRHPVTVFRTKAVDDDLHRIVRDPIRKLGKTDRFIGPALCAARNAITPYYICRSCAYAYLYRNEADLQSIRLQEMLQQLGIRRTVMTVSNLDPDVPEEKLVLDLIVNAYWEICGKDPLSETVD